MPTNVELLALENTSNRGEVSLATNVFNTIPKAQRDTVVPNHPSFWRAVALFWSMPMSSPIFCSRGRILDGVVYMLCDERSVAFRWMMFVNISAKDF